MLIEILKWFKDPTENVTEKRSFTKDIHNRETHLFQREIDISTLQIENAGLPSWSEGDPQITRWRGEGGVLGFIGGRVERQATSKSVRSMFRNSFSTKNYTLAP